MLLAKVDPVQKLLYAKRMMNIPMDPWDALKVPIVSMLTSSMKCIREWVLPPMRYPNFRDC